MSNSAATQVNHAKRFSPFLDLAEFAEFISEKDNRRLRGFRRVFSVAVGLWATQHYLCFSRQRDASHSEAATDEESETLQTEAVCFLFLAPQVTDRFAQLPASSARSFSQAS